MEKYTYRFYNYLKYKRKGLAANPYSLQHRLWESQYWPPEKYENYHLENLNALLIDAAKASEYYKWVLKDVSLPLKSLSEFSITVPVLTKESVKRYFETIKTQHFDGRFRHTTSGSTGDPVTIYTSALAEAYREAGLLRFLSWWDIEPYEKSIFIWASKSNISPGRQVVNMAKNRMRNRYYINVFKLNSETIEGHVKAINKFKPSYIRGIKSAVIQFADLLHRNKRLRVDLKLKAAIVTSEVLLESDRKYIEETLGCRVANEYGSAEVGQLGFECPSGSIHLYEEAVYMYTNNLNQVFATELFNSSMPLINYQNNDRVIISEPGCNCGIRTRIISKIEGRDDDILIKPDGERLNQNIFVFIIMELDDIGLEESIFKWKVIQEKNTFKIFIVPKHNYSSRVEEYIRKRFYEELGNNIAIEYYVVDSIPRESTGKEKLFIRIE